MPIQLDFLGPSHIKNKNNFLHFYFCNMSVVWACDKKENSLPKKTATSKKINHSFGRTL